jgi:succinoglycan biosynthesis transport protein ExoP
MVPLIQGELCMGNTSVQDTLGAAPPSAIPEFVYMLRKRRRLIVWCVLLTVGAAIYYSLAATPIFEATAVLKVKAKSNISPLTGQMVQTESWSSQQLDFKTNYEVITSNSVLKRVLQVQPVSEEKLEDVGIDKLISSILDNTKGLIIDLIGSAIRKKTVPTADSSHQLLMRKLDWLRGRIDVDEVTDTRLINITVEDPDPVFARNLANAVVETYIRYQNELDLETEKKTLLWMQEQIYESKKRVEDAEKRFIEYKEREKIFSLAGRQKIFSEKMAESNKALVKTRSQREAVDARIREIQNYTTGKKSDGDVSIPHFVKSKLISDLYGKYLEAEVEYRRISGVFGPKHPEIIKIRNKYQTLLAKLKTEVGKILQNLKSERAVLRGRESALKEAMRAYERQAIESNRKELAYNFLEREVQTNRQLYDLLLSKAKEAKVTGAITQSTLQLEEPALLPTEAVKPRKTLNVVLSFFVGLILGVGLALTRDIMDQTIHNGEEAERYLRMPVLAEIPKVKKPDRYGAGNKNWLKPNVIQLPLNSHYTEACRMLATNLSLSKLSAHHGVVIISSTTPSEGKSTIALNLGLTMAAQGLRTMVLEGDLRRPITHKQQKGKESAPGLSDFLISIMNRDITQGSLAEVGAADLHKVLRLQERTGIVSYDTPGGKFEVSFIKGRVVEADWDRRPERVPLGKYLVEKGILSSEQVEMALAYQSHSHRRIGQIMLGLGFAKAEDIVGPMRVNIQEDLQELYQLKEGTFGFVEQPWQNSTETDPQEELLLRLVSESESGTLYPRTRYLIDQLDPLLVKYDQDNFGYLPAGKPVPNPSTIIASKSLRYLIEEIKKHYDAVIIDSPPARIVSDASILADIADGAVYVVRSGHTHRRQVKTTIEQMENVNVEVIGCAINMMDFKRESYGGGYYGTYDHYYSSSG